MLGQLTAKFLTCHTSPSPHRSGAPIPASPNMSSSRSSEAMPLPGVTRHPHYDRPSPPSSCTLEHPTCVGPQPSPQPWQPSVGEFDFFCGVASSPRQRHTPSCCGAGSFSLTSGRARRSTEKSGLLPPPTAGCHLLDISLMSGTHQVWAQAGDDHQSKFEKLSSLDAPRSDLKDTGWSDVAGLLSKMNECMESIDTLCTEGPPYRIQGGMRDIGYQALGWSLGVHEEPSDELMHEDSGAESESIEAGRRNIFAKDDHEWPSFEDGAVSIVEDRVVSVTVGVPRRFGQSLCSDEDPESPQVTNEPSDQPGAAPEATEKTSLREILRKVTVNETVLRSAIDSLGGGVKGLQTVLDYVKHFQEAREPNAGNVSPTDFTRGLEQFCLLNDQAKPGSQNQPVNPLVPSANYLETHQGSGADVNQNRQALPNLHIRGQDEWSRNGRAGDPYTMGYMENMSGYFPNFCYPYPPPFASYGPFNLGVRPMYMPMMQVPYFTPPSLEYVQKTDAITKASRKSRIARRRGQGTDPHQARPATKIAHGGAGAAKSGNQDNMAHQKAAVSSSGQVMQGLSTRDLMLVLQKHLSPSGVSSLGRIVLPKKEAEVHLPHLVASEGVLLTMTDFDTAQSWTFRYRFWSNNKSRMYLLENTRDFVKAHNLQEGDMLSLYRDAGGSYVVRGERNGSNQTVEAVNDATVEEDGPAEDDLPQKKQKF